MNTLINMNVLILCVPSQNLIINMLYLTKYVKLHSDRRFTPSQNTFLLFIPSLNVMYVSSSSKLSFSYSLSRTMLVSCSFSLSVYLVFIWKVFVILPSFLPYHSLPILLYFPRFDSFVSAKKFASL